MSDLKAKAILFSAMKLGYALMNVNEHLKSGKFNIEFIARGEEETCFPKFVAEMRGMGFYITEVDLITKTNFIVKIEIEKDFFKQEAVENKTFYCIRCKKYIPYKK